MSGAAGESCGANWLLAILVANITSSTQIRRSRAAALCEVFIGTLVPQVIGTSGGRASIRIATPDEGVKVRRHESAGRASVGPIWEMENCLLSNELVLPE
jgi:hypothetical protein